MLVKLAVAAGGVVAGLAGYANAVGYQDTLVRRSSILIERCLGPCDCVAAPIRAPMSGDFDIRLITVGNVFDFYAVENIRWAVQLPDREILVTGSGTYRISTLAHLQQMDLTLSIDGGAPEYFFSDYLPLQFWLPNVEITLSTGLVGCNRTTIDIFGVPQCVADTDDGTGSGFQDGGVGIEDLLFYLGAYSAGTPRADVDGGAGNGIPDGGVGVEDLLYYLRRYDAGC